MQVTQLRIKNYRSFETETPIQLSSHVVLVGGNNAGKSNILRALELILGSRSPWRIRLDPDDYFDPSLPVSIGVTIGNISDADKSRLYPLCTNKQQRGALNSGSNLEVEIKLVIPAWERGDPETEEDDEHDDESPTKVQLEVKLWGFSVYRGGDDIRRALARSVVVSPHRRPESDLNASRWNPYGQLMKGVLESSAQYDDLRSLLGDLNVKIQDALGAQKQELLDEARVVSYVDDIEFRLTEHGDPTELLRNLEVFVSEGGHTSNIDRVGTGTQSAVIIAMFELVLKASGGHLHMLGIEEPEAFIHPHGARRIGRLLRSTSDGADMQVIVATHSPALVATLTPADITRVEMVDGATKVYQAGGVLSDPHFARHVTAETAEMFFAKRVVLVEGDTERFLIPPLASLIEESGSQLDLDRERISIISMGSKDNVVNYLKILDAFSIDTWAILDADFLAGTSVRSLVSHLRAEGVAIDDSSDSNLRRDLLAAQIIVLSQGEIEDYIPDADVVAASGKSATQVSNALASTPKRSTAFKAVFGTAKPQYAMTLASYYTTQGTLPSDLERLIKKIAV